MKALWKDKYLEICEKTLQTPGGTVVRGALLSHLKLNVSPIVQGNGCSDATTTVESDDAKNKKPCTRSSCLRRKRCMYRLDSRSKDSQKRSVDYYKKEIEKMPVYEELDLLTSDGYLIPEELKENIRKARSESQQKLELDRYLKERGLPRRPDEDTERLDNPRTSSGTYIAISYRNSKKNVTIASDTIQSDVQVETKYFTKPTTTENEVDDGEEESPYSIVRDLSTKGEYADPKYFIIDEDCEHGLPTAACTECEHYYTEVEFDLLATTNSRRSSASGNSAESDLENLTLHRRDTASSSGSFEYKLQDTIPETYLRRSIGMTTSNSTVGSTTTTKSEGGDPFDSDGTAEAEDYYYSLEELREDKTLMENVGTIKNGESPSEYKLNQNNDDNNNNGELHMTYI